jgi:hypothetical protein
MNLKLASVLCSFVLIGGLGVAFQACSEEEPAAEYVNELTVDGETFALTHGYLEMYQDVHPVSGAAVYKWSVNLESDEQSNIWHWVRFNLNSKIGTTLAPGTYTFDAQNSQNDLTFFFGEVVTNYDISSGDGEQYEDFEGGTVTVSKSDSKYTVVFDATMSGGIKVKGTYTGSLYVE